MGLPVRQQVIYWSFAAIVFLAVLWILGDVLLPFVLGGALAYCLDPLADRLEKVGLSRVLATIIITLFAIVIFVLAAVALIPNLVQQANALIDSAPAISARLQAFLAERAPALMEEGSAVRRALAGIGDAVQNRGAELANRVLSGAMTFVNAITLIVIVPVVAFYLLLDWDRMVAQIDGWLPRDHAPTIRKLAMDVDGVLAGFIRGQGAVCLILGTFYAVSLMVAGLNFGLVIGAIGGLLSFIPFVGATLGGALAVGLALFQGWGDWFWIAAIAGIFVVGQLIEGYVLTPYLVGTSVGLHPVWLLFSLSAFGSLFGFVGLLVAVPVAAAIGVFARFAISQYQKSRLYKGLSEQDDR